MRDSINCIVVRDRLYYPAFTYRTSNTNSFVKMRSSSINLEFSALQYRLLTSPRKENQALSEHRRSTSPSCTERRNQSHKFILATRSRSFKALTTLVQYVCSFRNVVVPPAAVIETSASCDRRLRDILGEVSSLASLPSNVSSDSTVHFLSGFLSGNDPVVFCLLTSYFVCLELFSWNRPESFSDIYICMSSAVYPNRALFYSTDWLAEECVNRCKHGDSWPKCITACSCAEMRQVASHWQPSRTNRMR